MKACLVTACGNKKGNKPAPAHLLYKSTRIRALYRRRGSLPMFILSAEYGLVEADRIIEPYNRVMTEERALTLAPAVSRSISEFDAVLFFKGGARREYTLCMTEAAQTAGVPLVMFGYGFMGDIGRLDELLRLLENDGLDDVGRLHGVVVI